MDESLLTSVTKKFFGPKLIKILNVEQLTQDNLPSEKQLQKLLKVGGNQALAAYAWRCSLRALPMVTAKLDLVKIWPEWTVKYISLIVRTNIFLQNIVREKRLDSVDFQEASYRADRAVEAARDRVHYVKKYSSNAARTEDVRVNVRADARAYIDEYRAAAMAAEASSVAAHTSSVAAKAVAAVSAVYTGGVSRPQLIRACIIDFNQLMEGCTVKMLCEQSLWQDDGLIQKTNALQKRFNEQLKGLGLGFLAGDITRVWNGEEIEEQRFARYTEKISDDILGDAKKFREYIVGEVEVKENTAVRVMLLGPGGAGKSSLRDLIFKRETITGKEATIDIDHNNHQPVELEVHEKVMNTEFPKDLNLYIWDFGGQSIFHNLHRGFIRNENCVYVVVVDSRHEQAPDDWLAQIRLHTGSYRYKSSELNSPTIPVLVVTNWYEKVQREQNTRRLIREYPDLLNEASFVELSCIQADDKFNKFVQRLVDTSIESRYKITADSRDAMKTTQALFADQQYVSNKVLRKKLGLSSEEKDGEWDSIVKSLDNLGQIIRLGKGQLCLNPNWIIGEAYKAINHNKLIENGGVLSTDDFMDNCLGHMENANNLEMFLKKHSAMHEFTPDCESYYFFPDAAPVKEPEWLAEFLRQPTHNKPVVIEYPFNTFPLGFKSQFAIQMIESGVLHIELKNNQSNVWRDGLFIDFNDKKAQLLVEFHLAKHVMKLSFFGGKASEYNTALREVHGAVQQIQKPLPSPIPVLVEGMQNLEQKGIQHLFEGISEYNLIAKGDGNVNIHIDKSTTTTIDKSPGAQLSTGDNSSNTSSITNSFNTNDAEAQKALFIDALEHTKTLTNQVAEVQVLEQAQLALQENRELDVNSDEGKVLEVLFERGKDIKDAVDMGKMLFGAIGFIIGG